MSWTMLVLLGYFVSSTHGADYLPDHLIPKDAMQPDWQCFQRGYRAACREAPFLLFTICHYLTCADDKLTNGMYTKSLTIGPALDGSFCGYTRSGDPMICYNKECRPIPKCHAFKFYGQGGKPCTLV